MTKVGSLFFFFLLFCQQLQAQDTLSVVEKDTSHSVKKAVILSAILPGAGQIYNHTAQPKGHKNAFWKVPLIYAGLGATGYFFLQNQLLATETKNEYKARQNGGELNPKYSPYDAQGVLSLYTSYSKRRDFSIVGMILVYGLQLADAAVEAHFVSFDISEDLSLTLNPWLHTQSNTVGLSFSLKIR